MIRIWGVKHDETRDFKGVSRGKHVRISVFVRAKSMPRFRQTDHRPTGV